MTPRLYFVIYGESFVIILFLCTNCQSCKRAWAILLFWQMSISFNIAG